MGISHTCPAPFNFLNGTGMGIGFAKRGGVGMGATHPEPAPLPFLPMGGNFPQIKFSQHVIYRFFLKWDFTFFLQSALWSSYITIELH